MKKKVQWIKWLIHFPCLFISMVMVIYKLYHWSTHPMLQYFFIFVAIVIELVAQYFRGMISLHFRLKLSCFQLRILGYLLGFGLYIAAFAYPAAVSVFSNEMNIIKQDQETAAFSQNEMKAEYEEVKEDIKRYGTYRQQEESTGRGTKFSEYENKIESLKKQRDDLKARIEANAEKQSQLEKNAISDTDDGSTKLMFIAALIMVYGGLVLTPWNIPASVLLEDEEESSESSKEPPTPQTKLSELAPTPSAPGKFLTEKEKMVAFVKSLYNVNDIEQLKKFQDAYNDVKYLGATYRECSRFLEKLNQLGAIVTIAGRNSRGIWKLDEILEYVERVQA